MTPNVFHQYRKWGSKNFSVKIFFDMDLCPERILNPFQQCLKSPAEASTKIARHISKDCIHIKSHFGKLNCLSRNIELKFLRQLSKFNDSSLSKLTKIKPLARLFSNYGSTQANEYLSALYGADGKDEQKILLLLLEIGETQVQMTWLIFQNYKLFNQ